MTKNWAGAVAEAQQAALRKALESSPLALKPRNRGAERRTMTMITYEYRGVYVREWPSGQPYIAVFMDGGGVEPHGSYRLFDNISAAVARFIELVQR